MANGPIRRKTEKAVRDRAGVPVGLLYDETNDKTIMQRANTDGAAKIAMYAYDEINGEWHEVEFDPHSGAITTIDEEHHKIHAGMHFYVDEVMDVAINGVLDLQWTMPDSTWLPHFTFEISPNMEVEWFVYEGAVATVAGTALTMFNNDRNNTTNPTRTVMKYHVNTSLANANADTDVTGATAIAHGKVGDGRTAGINVRTRELMLKRDTIYCLRGVAAAAGYINFKLEWYEHEPHITPYGL